MKSSAPSMTSKHCKGAGAAGRRSALDRQMSYRSASIRSFERRSTHGLPPTTQLRATSSAGRCGAS